MMLTSWNEKNLSNCDAQERPILARGFKCKSEEQDKLISNDL